MNILHLLDRYLKIQETPQERSRRLAEYCQPNDHVWVANSYHQGFGCDKCNYSYWDWSHDQSQKCSSCVELQAQIDAINAVMPWPQAVGMYYRVLGERDAAIRERDEAQAAILHMKGV